MFKIHFLVPVTEKTIGKEGEDENNSASNSNLIFYQIHLKIFRYVSVMEEHI